MEFIEAIRERRSEIKFPTQRKFSVKTWKSYKQKYEFKELRSSELFDAGLFFFEVFESLREKLSKIDAQKPENLSKSDLLRYFCGLSNRHRRVLGEKVENQVQQLMEESVEGKLYGDQLHNITGASLAGGGALSIEDSAHQIVDNFTHILRSLHFPSKSIDSKKRKPVKADEK